MAGVSLRSRYTIYLDKGREGNEKIDFSLFMF